MEQQIISIDQSTQSQTVKDKQDEPDKEIMNELRDSLNDLAEDEPRRAIFQRKNTDRDSIYISENKTIGNYNEDELREVVDKYKKLLKGNEIYVQAKLSQDPDYFQKLALGQSPSYLLIGCADSRVPPDQLTQSQPGEMFIHRNVANIVNLTDMNILSVIQFAVEVLKVKHIIVMGHTHCGGVKASMTKCYHGLIDHWLLALKDVQFKHQETLNKIKNDEEKLRKLIELNVQEQALNVCKTSFVQKAWANNQTLHVHGWITELETGRIIDLKIHKDLWKSKEDFYTYNFVDTQKE